MGRWSKASWSQDTTKMRWPRSRPRAQKKLEHKQQLSKDQKDAVEPRVLTRKPYDSVLVNEADIHARNFLNHTRKIAIEGSPASDSHRHIRPRM